MTEPVTVYDLAIDDRRPATQADVTRLERYVQAYAQFFIRGVHEDIQHGNTGPFIRGELQRLAEACLSIEEGEFPILSADLDALGLHNPWKPLPKTEAPITLSATEANVLREVLNRLTAASK